MPLLHNEREPWQLITIRGRWGDASNDIAPDVAILMRDKMSVGG